MLKMLYIMLLLLYNLQHITVIKGDLYQDIVPANKTAA